MNMLRKWNSIIVMLTISVVISVGCGGGGSSSPPPPPPATSSVSGVASKGHLSGATVTAYSLNASGVKGSARGSSTTNANGAYSINLGTYTGAMLIEASGGSYTDEATGSSVTNTVLLRAAVTNVSGSVQAAVTPMTEIAVQKAGTLTAANINAANAIVSNMIGGTNIITTMPADVLVSSSSTTTEKNYGLALATISQMVSDGTATDVLSAISMIVTDLADNTLDTTGADISSALSTFIAGTSNHTGLDSSTAPVVSAISNATNNPISTLQATYHHIDQSVGFYTYVNNSITYAASMAYGDTATFILDGQGNYTVSGSGINYDMLPASNTVISTPDTFSNVTGTYTVGNGGMVTFDWNSTPSWVSVDGSIIISGEASVSGTLHQSEQRIEIKGGAGMSNASLNGTYAVVSQSIGFGSGAGWANSNFYGDSGYITFDGAGNLTWTGSGWFYEMNHNANTINQKNPETGTWMGTYSVANDGAITLTGSPYGGWVSADGNIFILGGAYVDGDIRASEQDIAVKLGTSMNNASLNGTFKLVMQSAGFSLNSSITGTVAGSMVHTYGPDTWTFDGSGGCSVTSE
ncbi:MAG: hypothetical protein HGA43_10435, partial [Nitrospirae bacterium]|nr:hypothetical protein [Nitrospirota bacterium]